MRALLAVSLFALPLVACTNSGSGKTGDDTVGDDDGTGSDQTPPEDPQPLDPDANGCVASALLDGMSNENGSATFGPYIFGSGRFCLHLDGTRNYYPHFAASTDYFPGETTPLTLTLLASDGTILGTGWPVAVGNADTHAFENLEMSFPGGSVLDVILVVEGTGMSHVSAALLEPYE